MGSSPLAVSSLVQGIFVPPKPKLCNDDLRDRGSGTPCWTKCVSCVPYWNLRGRGPKRRGEFPTHFRSWFFVGGFRKREQKRDGNSWKMVGGIWIWVVLVVVFSWCCFLFRGETKDGAPPRHFLGGWFLNYRLSMIDDVRVSQGPLKKQWNEIQ